MALSCIISKINRDIGRKSSFFHTRLAFDTLVKGVGGSCRNSALKFGTEKLTVWLPDGEKNEDTYIRFHMIHERVGHTDGQTDRQADRQTPHDDISRAYASHRAVKMLF